MFNSIDLLLIVAGKLLLLIGFIYGIRYWILKQPSTLPLYVYWVLGLFFTLMLGWHVFEVIFYYIFIVILKSTMEWKTVSGLAVIAGIIFFGYIGKKMLGYWKKFKQLKI